MRATELFYLPWILHLDIKVSKLLKKLIIYSFHLFLAENGAFILHTTVKCSSQLDRISHLVCKSLQWPNFCMKAASQ